MVIQRLTKRDKPEDVLKRFEGRFLTIAVLLPISELIGEACTTKHMIRIGADVLEETDNISFYLVVVCKVDHVCTLLRYEMSVQIVDLKVLEKSLCKTSQDVEENCIRSVIGVV